MKHYLLNKIPVIIFSLTCIAYITGCRPVQAIYSRPDLQVPDSFRIHTIIPAMPPVSKQTVFTDIFLVNLIDKAVQNNPDVAIALQKIQVMQSQFRIRKGAMLPVAAADGTISVQKYGDYTMEGVGNFDTNLSGNIKEDQKAPVPLTPNYFLGFRSSWEIDLWGKLKQRKESAYLQLLASEQGKNLVITNLVAEVAGRYYELLSLDAKLAILRSNIILQDSAVSIAEIQKEAGRTTELGVQQFRAQSFRTRSLLSETELETMRVENEISYLLGAYPQKIPRNTGFPDAVTAASLPGTPADLLHRRPDVLEAELLLRAAGADVQAAKAEFLPSLTLAPFVGLNTFNGSLLFRPGSIAYGIGGNLTAPLLNRSLLKGNLSRSEAEQQQAHHSYRKTVLNAFSEVQTAVQSIEQMQQVYAMNRKETEILSSAISISNELYKVGYASYLEVITAQKTALEAELNLVETKKRLYHSLVDVYRSMGGGW